MKIKNLLSSFVVLFSITLLVSCENEPLDPVLASQLSTNNTGGTSGTGGSGGTGGTGGVTPASIVGTYILTAFNTSVPTDLNGDGANSTNQMNETTCFNNSLFTLNSDNTFIANSKGIDIDITTTPNTLTCYTDPDTTGTWTLTGNILKTTYVEGGVTYNDQFTVVGNTLVYTESSGQIVGTASGNPVYLTSDIALVYSKQ